MVSSSVVRQPKGLHNPENDVPESSRIMSEPKLSNFEGDLCPQTGNTTNNINSSTPKVSVPIDEPPQ